jgi:ribokinase
MISQRTNPPTGTLAIVGSVNVDLSWSLHNTSTTRSPIAPGYTWLAVSNQGVGGKGANAAIYAARFHNVPVELLCALGDDELATWCRAEIGNNGVHLSVEEHDKIPTGRAGIITDSEGHNLIAVDLGANRYLSGEFVRDQLSRHRAAVPVVLTNLEVSAEAASAAADYAHHHGSLLIVDPSPINELHSYAGVLEHASILLPNEVEYEILLKEASSILRHQQDNGGYLVVTRGENGIDIYRDHRHVGHIEATTVDLIDTVGAGDCLAGTLGACLAGVSSALSLATTAASLSTKGAGAHGYSPTLSEAQSLHDHRR